MTELDNETFELHEYDLDNDPFLKGLVWAGLIVLLILLALSCILALYLYSR